MIGQATSVPSPGSPRTAAKRCCVSRQSGTTRSTIRIDPNPRSGIHTVVSLVTPWMTASKVWLSPCYPLSRVATVAMLDAPGRTRVLLVHRGREREREREREQPTDADNHSLGHACIIRAVNGFTFLLLTC